MGDSIHFPFMDSLKGKYNVRHIIFMHAGRPHRRKDQLPLRLLRDLRSR